MSEPKKALEDYVDPKKTGTTAIIMAIISFFIFGSSLSIMASVAGGLGAYSAIKKKSGAKILVLNIVAIILGITSNVLLNVLLS